MKGNRKYIVVLLVLFGALVTVMFMAPEPISWTATFSKNDQQPFGSKLLYDNLDVLFPEQEVTDATLPAYNVDRENPGAYNYLILTTYLNTPELDEDAIIRSAERGANIFIGTNGLSKTLSDTLGLEVDDGFEFNVFDTEDDTVPAATDYYRYSDIEFKFTDTKLQADSQYYFGKGLSGNYINVLDESRTTVLAEDGEGNTVMVRVKVGRGYVYVTSLSRIFTNYFISDKRNYQVVFKALSYLPSNLPVVWDEYYGKPSVRPTTELRFLLQNRSLKYAWFITLLGLTLFMVFNAKRRQRVIPIVKPLENTSLKFVDVVGRLYFQKGDHSHIATKKITYFLSHIREHYGLQTDRFDAAFYRRLSQRSSIPVDELESLFRFIDQVYLQDAVADTTLIELNKRIERFKQKSQR